MKRLSLLALFLALLCCAASGQEYELSYLVVRAKDNQVLFSQEPEKFRVPASTMKVVTAASALEHLGPEHRFQTQARASGPIKKGRVDELCLVGEADPELTEQALQSLVDQLKESGLRSVGHLTVAPGPNSFPPYGSGWAWDDAGSSYSPEISGLNLNGGVWSFESVASETKIETRPGIPKGYWLVPGRAGIVTGSETPKRIAPPTNAEFTAKLFQELLQTSGVKVSGEIKVATPPEVLLATHQSRPLRELLKSALAKSDNLAMELFYRASDQKPPKVLEDAPYRQADGSGLSRYNLISCQQLVTVLSKYPELKTLVPTPGNGTLKSRFLDGLVTPHLAAKTGTMSNISGLAGYLFPGTEKECYFAILINGHLDTTSKRKAIENDLVKKWVLEIAYPYLIN